MPYTLIKGDLIIHYPDRPHSGPEPDGDTLKFLPDNRQLIENLPRGGRPPKFTRAGITTIRFEGIDTLESHYIIEGDAYHQNLELALDARDTLLALSGFGEVRYFPDSFKVDFVENHPIRGYILSNGLDVHGRSVAFVFAGEHAGVDGTQLHVEPAMLDSSLNAQMLNAGQAYGAFYLNLPAALREHLKLKATQARNAKLGLWAHAQLTTTVDALIEGPENLQQLVIWPKLFRRLASFFQDGNTSLSQLDAWLRDDSVDRDDRLLLPNYELGNMHDMIHVVGNRMHLTHLPEEVVIVPDNFVMPTEPDNSVVGTGEIRVVAALINPKGQDRTKELITLLNTSDTAIDLTGYSISDNSGNMPLLGVLNAGASMQVFATGSVRLNNDGDTITVLGPDGTLIHQVTYIARDVPDEGITLVF